MTPAQVSQLSTGAIEKEVLKLVPDLRIRQEGQVLVARWTREDQVQFARLPAKTGGRRRLLAALLMGLTMPPREPRPAASIATEPAP